MYGVPYPVAVRSDEDQLQWLDILRGCLYEGNGARYEKQMRSLVAEMTKKLESQQQRVDTLTEIVGEKERNEATLKQQVEEIERERGGARSKTGKSSLAAEKTKNFESKQQHVDTLTTIVGEKEQNEMTLQQQVEEIKKGRERGGARSKTGKSSLAAEKTKNFESKQQHVDTLTTIVGEKEQNEMTLQQQVEEIKKGRERGGARSKTGKSSLAAEKTMNFESKQQHVDTLTTIVGETGRNEMTLQQQVEEIKIGRERGGARSKTEKSSLAAEKTKNVESKQQLIDTLAEIVGEKERNETTLTQQVEELKKGREEDRARAEKEKRSLAAEMTKKLASKQQQVDILTELVGEKERNETILGLQFEEQMKGREEDRGRAEKEKRSLAADMMKKLASKQQQVDTLTEIVGEKERNETTLRQQVEELRKGRERDKAQFDKRSIELSWKKERDYTELSDQLERENWKLRTKIQLGSKIRSAEQKKKAETHQSSFIPWVTSGKQAQGGKTLFSDVIFLFNSFVLIYVILCYSHLILVTF